MCEEIGVEPSERSEYISTATECCTTCPKYLLRSVVLFTPPCFAALGAMNSEINDRKWFWGGVALQLGTGFTVGYLVYQMGTLVTTGGFGAGFLPGLIAVAVMAGIVCLLCARNGKTTAAKQ